MPSRPTWSLSVDVNKSISIQTIDLQLWPTYTAFKCVLFRLWRHVSGSKKSSAEVHHNISPGLAKDLPHGNRLNTTKSPRTYGKAYIEVVRLFKNVSSLFHSCLCVRHPRWARSVTVQTSIAPTLAAKRSVSASLFASGPYN